MSELETKLRQLAKNGELTYLSMISVAGLGEYGCTFVAQVPAGNQAGFPLFAAHAPLQVEPDPVIVAYREAHPPRAES